MNCIMFNLKIVLIIAIATLPYVVAFKMNRPWTEQHWCESVEKPHWPFAYNKEASQNIEIKGRVASNLQHVGHSCIRKGALSTCNICEKINCDINSPNAGVCDMQLQGLLVENLPKNIPTVSDAPWSIGGSHRYDFGTGSHVCVMLSGGDCIRHESSDYSSCRVRCWGHSYSNPIPFNNDWQYPDSVRWTYDKLVGQPQGYVNTLAGGSGVGFKDGTSSEALFNHPQAVAVDRDRNVYVADTLNHAIRKITPEGVVTTIAGTGNNEPFVDGILSEATFSHPGSITLYYDYSVNFVEGILVLIVADTGNHKIRKIFQGQVTTLSGLKGQTSPQPGFADGPPESTRFNNPTGVAADDDGVVFVADRDNHIIRKVNIDGHTETLAGTLETSSDIPGCTAPCLRGVPGFDDGSLTTAKFNFPRGIAVGLNHTILVVDDDRIRRITYRNIESSQQGILSLNRVATIAGGLVDGDNDGYGKEALFRDPQGLTMTDDGRIYVADTTSCRVRRISSSRSTSVPITCDVTGVDVLRPSGCLSYDPPVGAYEIKVSQAVGNIYYNYNQTTDILQDGEYIALGRLVKDCQGVPPFKDGVEFTGNPIGAVEGTTTTTLEYKEDTDDGTEIKLRCPSGCAASAVASGEFSVWGNDIYTDYSKVCEAALHAGVITDAGGIIVITLTSESPNYSGSTGLNEIVSSSVMTKWHRGFRVKEYVESLVEVQTVAGLPTANLDDVCGYTDTQPPSESQFLGLTDVAVYTNASLSDMEFLYIADEKNHAIRLMTAVCSQTCENGGLCVGPELCQCPAGWTGVDCTRPTCSTPCAGRTLCTSPDTCTCIPGYTGFPACDVPICVQSCGHGGDCIAPDTCGCVAGWFDANCTTPVCEQTCGNGGNCTSPSTCSCPSEWSGSDCRTPVCTQDCKNGGVCIAPDTCMCHHSWSGFDCSWPVCSQGYLVIDETLPKRPTYMPCTPTQWCEDTNGFDCRQETRLGTLIQAAWGALRGITGRKDPPSDCVLLEVGINADTYFQYEDASGGVTPYFLHSPLTTYTWEGGKGDVWNSPFETPPDRQVALAELRLVPQGKYVCANSGDCLTPDVCKCDESWVGFDCRIPVCEQGYFEQGQDGRDPLWGGKYHDWHGSDAGQGGYECSSRAHTPWERAECDIDTMTCIKYVHEHENFYSRYMDGDTAYMSQWDVWAPPEAQGWAPLHFKKPALNDDTDEGWRRDGWWEKTGEEWEKGTCTTTYKRICNGNTTKISNLWDGLTNTIVTVDTDVTFRPVISHSNATTTAYGRWFNGGGECVDTVLKGCYNNGTCSAPGVCDCQPGWEGSNCLSPLCEQNCFHHGNCTLPNICTCEKGWEGFECSIPICAQECKNGGTCVAPDVCECVTWPSEWYDKRRAGGKPLFRQPNGDPQLTGWTGYDCSTPICTQAESFVLNDADGTIRLGGYGWILYGDEPTNNLEGQPPPPPYSYTKTLLPGDGQVIRNDGKSFQSGCLETSNRTSLTHLCGKLQWEQGDYIDGRYVRANHHFYVQDASDPERWFQGDITPGEGVYACYNRGSCINPDVCTCPDGWSGYDCNIPLCRHLQPFPDAEGNAVIVGCLNEGICAGKDDCHCVKTDSLLEDKKDSEAHTDLTWMRPDFETGYNGTDCSIPMCIQGWFDPFCDLVAPGGEGCFRCANGGNCTAPDFCTCTEDWTGFDCRTPVCTYEATSKTIEELDTVDPLKVIEFEQDPCRMNVKESFNGAFIGQGNCTEPNVCQCLCKVLAPYDENGEIEEEPWVDPLERPLGPGYKYGSFDCLSGYEGYLDEYGQFETCHYIIYEPTWWERHTITIIVWSIILFILFLLCYYNIRKYLKRKRLLEKIEKRRSRRSSEEERRSKENPGTYKDRKNAKK